MTYLEKKQKAIEQFLFLKDKGPISLKPKFTSHFFRVRNKKNKLDLTAFDQVINVDIENKIVEVEGLCTFYNLAKECLNYNMLPVIVPELRNITIGGTISGLGIESSSYIYGMVHNSIIECDVLTSTGEVITCSREQNSDLFYALPNSIGTVGYVLKCKFKIRKSKKYTKIDLHRYSNSKEYFDALKSNCEEQKYDFIDGIIYSPDHYVMITGTLTNELPHSEKTINFKQEIYWKYMHDKELSYLYMNTWDYLWRWDTDVFWSLNVPYLGPIVNNKLFRLTLGRVLLKSHIMGKISHWYLQFQNSSLYKFLNKNKIDEEEYILQDLCIDLDKCSVFLEWYKDKIAVYPIWICPSDNQQDQGKYPLHDFKCDYLVDIGIYTGKKRESLDLPSNYYNRLLEEKILELKGMKGLYSMSYFTENEFWSMYHKDRYLEIKKSYDPKNVFPDIFTKTIGKKTS